MPITREPPPSQYNGLTQLVPGMPADAYFDPRQFERELARIWYRNWVYVSRSSDIAQPRAFRTFELGDQRILLVRDDAGVLKGFHNTCRHRGAALCRENQGTLRSAAIVCPYHAWTYGLDGELKRTSSKRLGDGFDMADYPLYRVHVRETRGFIFVALEDPPPFDQIFDPPLDRLDEWPLEDVVVAHVITKTIQCNWKLFWENFNECLHCPGVHPTLCRLVPIYGRGLVREGDDPNWAEHAADPDPRYKGGLRNGAHTWSNDGQPAGLPFAGLSDEQRRRGAQYVTCVPSVFIVGHLDYLRVLRVRPLAPEHTELRIEYLVSAETLRQPNFDLRPVIEFTDAVMSEDAQVCELNQRGLKAAPHTAGVVMPEEYLVRNFQEWVLRELARP